MDNPNQGMKISDPDIRSPRDSTSQRAEGLFTSELGIQGDDTDRHHDAVPTRTINLSEFQRRVIYIGNPPTSSPIARRNTGIYMLPRVPQVSVASAVGDVVADGASVVSAVTSLIDGVVGTVVSDTDIATVTIVTSGEPSDSQTLITTTSASPTASNSSSVPTSSVSDGSASSTSYTSTPTWLGSSSSLSSIASVAYPSSGTSATSATSATSGTLNTTSTSTWSSTSSTSLISLLSTTSTASTTAASTSGFTDANGTGQSTTHSVKTTLISTTRSGHQSDSRSPSSSTSTGVSSTGVSSTGVSSTGVSSTDVSSTGVSSTGVSSTGVSSTGVSSTGVSSTGVSSTGVSSTGVSGTGVSSTGVSGTGVSGTGRSSASSTAVDQNSPGTGYTGSSPTITSSSAATTSSTSSSSDGGGPGLSPQQQQVVGGVVGGVAGLAILLLVLLVILRWYRRRLKARGELPEQIAAPSLTGPGQPVSQRSSVVPLTSQLASSLRRLRHTSGHTQSTSISSVTVPESERGFQRIAGRKIAPVLTAGGDGFGGNYGAFMQDTVPASPPNHNQGGLAGPSSHQDGSGLVAGRGTTAAEVKSGHAHGPSLSRDFATPADNEPNRSQVSLHSGRAEGVVSLRPSPARTPVTVSPAASSVRLSIQHSPSVGDDAPPVPQIVVPFGQDDVGRTMYRQDGSRISTRSRSTGHGSRFAENI